MNKDKLNKKLAEWAEFQFMDDEGYWIFKPHPTYESIEIVGQRWITPDGTGALEQLPDFTDPNWGIARCFKWLVPQLQKEILELSIEIDYLPNDGGYNVAICDAFYDRDEPSYMKSVAFDESVATALSLATEKLIDGEQC